MVLPLVDEHKPKCYLCHEGFEDIEKLRAHQNTKHSDFFKSNEKQTAREPAPGDVTVF
jgi:quinol monooxygenase YgiN